MPGNGAWAPRQIEMMNTLQLIKARMSAIRPSSRPDQMAGLSAIRPSTAFTPGECQTRLLSYRGVVSQSTLNSIQPVVASSAIGVSYDVAISSSFHDRGGVHPPSSSWQCNVLKSHWRFALTSAEAVAFGTAVVIDVPLRELINFAKAGTGFSAKQLCSGVLMAGMDPKVMRNEDLAAGKGLIQTKIDESQGRVEARALFGLIRAEAVRNGGRGCSQRIGGESITRLPHTTKPIQRDPSPSRAPWQLVASASPEPPR